MRRDNNSRATTSIVFQLAAKETKSRVSILISRYQALARSLAPTPQKSRRVESACCWSPCQATRILRGSYLRCASGPAKQTKAKFSTFRLRRSELLCSNSCLRKYFACLEMSEIDATIEGLSPASRAKVDAADAIPQSGARPQVTQANDLWVLDRHRVLCSDARNVAAYSTLMQDRHAAAVFSEPPYNDPIDGYVTGFGKIHHAEFPVASGEMSVADFTTFLTAVLTLLARYSTDGALQFICMDWRHMPELLAAAKQAYTEFKNLCVWVKDVAGQGSLYRSQHELIFVFKSGKRPHRNNIQLGQFGRYRTNVWHYRRVNCLGRTTDESNLKDLHPTIKPVEIVADAILDCTARGDVVLDPFLGSGTTVIAAERTGRVCYGIELDPRYVDTIR